VPKLNLKTAEGVDLRLDIAGAGSRFAAGLIDGALLALLFTAVLLVLALVAQFDVTGLSGFVYSFAAMASLLFAVLLNALYTLYGNGQTPGRKFLGLRVIGADGYRPSAQQAFLRALVWIVDAVLWIPIPLGVIVIALSPRRQRLGDLVAGTIVVRDALRSAAREPWARENWSDLPHHMYSLSAATAARFDEEDMRVLRDVITRSGLAPRTRSQLYKTTAELLLARADLSLHGEPRAAIKELYLFLREQRTGRVEPPPLPQSLR